MSAAVSAGPCVLVSTRPPPSGVLAWLVERRVDEQAATADVDDRRRTADRADRDAHATVRRSKPSMPIHVSTTAKMARPPYTAHRLMCGVPVVKAGPEPLAHVDERVDQHDDLQPAHRLQRPPRVVDAAEERDRQHDEGEQVRHLLRRHLGPEHEPEGGGHPAGERGQRDQRQPVDVQVHGRRRDDVGDREHEQRGEQRVQHAGDDLLDADRLRRQRRQHAVLDLLGVAELLHQRQGDGLDALEHDGEADDAGDERGRERLLAAARRRRPGRSSGTRR